MGRVARRSAIVVMLGVLALSATACGPGAGEGLFQAYMQFAGPIIGIGLLLAILLGGIPKA